MNLDQSIFDLLGILTIIFFLVISVSYLIYKLKNRSL